VCATASSDVSLSRLLSGRPLRDTSTVAVLHVSCTVPDNNLSKLSNYSHIILTAENARTAVSQSTNHSFRSINIMPNACQHCTVSRCAWLSRTEFFHSSTTLLSVSSWFSVRCIAFQNAAQSRSRRSRAACCQLQQQQQLLFSITNANRDG
jgi:hypothetical protein